MDMMTDNELPLAVIDVAFQFVEFFFGVITNLILPAVLTPLFQGIFGLFTGTTT